MTKDIRICPQCGSEMRLRERRSGENAGTKYWVCTKYPDCKSVEMFMDNYNQPEDSASEGTENIDNIAAPNNNSAKTFYCRNCGAELGNNVNLCKICGSKKQNNKIVPVLISVITILISALIGISIYKFGTTKQSNAVVLKSTVVAVSTDVKDEKIDAKNFLKLNARISRIKYETEKSFYDEFMLSLYIIATESINNFGMIEGALANNNITSEMQRINLVYVGLRSNYKVCMQYENQKFLDAINGKTPLQIIDDANQLKKLHRSLF